jgi:uncharacterized protein
MMRVVLAGGTGFVGRSLCKAFVRRGDEVVVLTRGKAREEGGVRFATWDAEHLGDWAEGVAAADCVVNLTGKGIMDERWSPAFLADCRKSRVASTAILAQAMAEGVRDPKQRVLVNASAVGYYGDGKSAELDEQAPKGADTLSTMCSDWEDAARPAEACARVVLARIGVVLGKEGGALEKMLPPFRAFVGGPLGSGKQYLAWIHERDVCEAIVFLCTKSELSGPVNLTAPHPATMREFAKNVGEVLRRPSMFPVPEFALRAMLGERAEVLLTGQNAVPAKLNQGHFAFMFPHLKDALQDLIA